MNLLVINGPNLNMLGKREAVYGQMSLEDIKIHTEKLIEKNLEESIALEWFQSNCEGAIIDKIHMAIEGDYVGVVINPGGLSHTSVSLKDALAILTIPVIEVHLTNVYQREDYRKSLLTAESAKVIIGGAGLDSYYLGVYSCFLQLKR